MENTLTPPACDSPAPQPVDLAAIEEELARFWHDPEAPETGAPVTRACMANLVICCRNPDEERELLKRSRLSSRRTHRVCCSSWPM